MLTINMHNNTGLDYDQVFRAITLSMDKDPIIKNRNLRIHNGRRNDGIISLTMCEKRGNNDCVLECDINDIGQVRTITKSLHDLPPIKMPPRTRNTDTNENYVINEKGECVE